ncbi:NAD(P)/FAD-dependent oxidoreductase [Streptomyces sp. NPDC088747]|uniref:NAD(P)/FAD-dependent oxidoreductase n=1 Tax=Streptomyces sp. NPDC088747 TaxID=3365886 RepID=UPI00380DF65C
MAGGDVVIVGGSLGGLHTAEALRGQGWTGAITVVDTEPEPRYDRPPLSKQYLGAGTSVDEKLLRAPQDLDALGLDWRLGERAVRLRPAEHRIDLAGGDTLGFGKLVIATGVRAVWPPALRVPAALTLRTRDDAARLRAELAPGVRLVVVGAGFIGLEVAATFRAAGAEVDVIETEQAPLTRQLGPEVGRALQRLHEAHGVRFHLGTRAASAVPAGDGCRVELSDGRRLDADVLLVAIGSVPAVDWLADSGLTLDNGVVCDTRLAAAPDVFAVGDVVRWTHPMTGRTTRIEHWTNAVEQAAHVARHIIAPDGGHAPFGTVPYFWSDHYGSRVQAHGFVSGEHELELLDGELDGGRFAALYRRDGRITGVVGLDNPRQVLAGRRRVVADLTAEEALS